MSDHTFCRLYLKKVMKDVFKHTTPEFRKYAWTHQTGRTYEFIIHNFREGGGKEFYWHGQCHCKWDCQAKGWEAWMREKGIEAHE